MKSLFKILAISAAVVMSGSLAHADESEFLRTLDGSWRGKGEVKIRTNRKPINVTCDFTSSGKGAAFLLDGRCRGLIVVSRKIRADLKARGNSYSGAYIGAGTGTAGLSGKRRGDTINLSVRWAKEVNGDRQAQMRVEKLNQNAMRLTTIDKDPATGRNVVTSDIKLQRR
jgi:hypothetical protein